MHELKAKKSLGQNFLNNQEVVSLTVQAAEIKEGDTVIEIGPGTGILTAELIRKGAKVFAYEKDHRAIELLNKKFSTEISANKLRLIYGDFLESNFTDDVGGISYKIVANIPYYITGAIIRKSLESSIQPSLIILMVQKEVGERVALKDNKHSLLSLSIWLFAQAKIVLNVPRESFQPVPKVDSVVIKIDSINKNFFLDIQTKLGEAGNLNLTSVYEKVFDVIRAGFAHKRKKLISNLNEYLESVSKPIDIKSIFKENNLDENVRAEDLSLDEWKNLSTKIITQVHRHTK